MVSSAFAWIGQIVEWFGQFFPRFQTLDIRPRSTKKNLSAEADSPLLSLPTL